MPLPSADIGAKLRVIAAGSVLFTAGAPTFAFNSGDFVNAITDNGPGNITLTMKAGLDSLNCAVVASPRATLAASQLTTVGCTHTSDTAKLFTVLQEGAAGAVSAPADVNFDFLMVGINA